MKLLELKGYKLAHRNFEGRGGRDTLPGRRSFRVVLDKETAEKLLAERWDVTMASSRNAHIKHPYTLRVVIDSLSPEVSTVYVKVGSGWTELDGESCALLDILEIEGVDLLIQPKPWEWENESGITAYLKSITVYTKS